MISQWFPLLLIEKQGKPLQTEESNGNHCEIIEKAINKQFQTLERAMKSIAKSLKKQSKSLQILERAKKTIAKSLKIKEEHSKTIE